LAVNQNEVLAQFESLCADNLFGDDRERLLNLREIEQAIDQLK
jgi:hemolysin activation/secretion protein